METVNITYLGTGGAYQDYVPADASLINSSLINATFGAGNDYIEYFIKDVDGEVLDANYNDTTYRTANLVDPATGTYSLLKVNPQEDAELLGYDRGSFNVKYNFLTTQLLSRPFPEQNFWIKEISTSRTEIKAARQDLSNTQLADAFAAFNSVLSADAYYPTFYLNFGLDNLVIGINAVYVEENGVGYVIFKLYEPLPDIYDLKSQFWVVTQAANSAEYNVTINIEAETIPDTQRIRGANFDVKINNTVGQTTPYYSYTTLFSTALTSSYQQLQSIMQDKGILINTDYSNLSNFIHFSSATERLYNFVYKLQLIESASVGLTQTNTTQARIALQSQIDNTITNFDGWEYYMYYTSESTAWPKQNSTTPYTLYSVTSSEAQNWLGGVNIVPTAATMSMFWSASYYDNTNKDWLLYATPAYIAEDSQNAPYLVFLNMIGQHFDNIWIYYKDVTNHYSAQNNPFVGISMDQVANALKSFGVQLYTNTSVADSIYASLLGLNQTGSNLPVTSSNYATVVLSSSSIYPLPGNDWLSASVSLPPFEEEKINRYVLTFISGSPTTSSFQSLPDGQLTGEIYKRIYHNLPYLLKTRGTERGVKALIATYGVPADIMPVHEYGGYNYLEYPGIQEISPVRIMTGSVLQISSSLLSPYATLQYYSNDLQNTSITVQAGFSPADSINAAITSSGYVTSSTQPGYFNIMQLIGNPILQYADTYTPLDEVSNTFFTNTFFERNNVWDFIRIIKYYNNSLFKMLRDWVPARVSADTGIVIKSHMLERNKYARKEPTWSTASYTASLDLLEVVGSDGGAVIGNTNFVQVVPIQYNGTASMAFTASPGYVYVSQSYGWPQYTGEFDGTTIIGATNYFPQEEVSSYITFWTSSVPSPNLSSPSTSLFISYSLGALYQNVYTPVRSQRFYDLDFNNAQIIPVNYGLITQSMAQTLIIGNVSQSEQPYSQYAFIQDFNYYSRGYTNARYSGSTLSGLYYNTYSAGDVSYGASPVINWYSNKLGLFTQIATSSFIPGAVNVSLAYLADVSGGLFELNQNNRNWVDVQNIFEAGTTLTVKQFDNRKYGNQVSTDGIKTIYNSGYNYTPQLYFASGTDNRLYFQFLGSTVDVATKLYNSGSPNNYIHGVPSPTYGTQSSAYEIEAYLFDTGSNTNITTLGTWFPSDPGTQTPALFQASQSAPYVAIANFDLTVEFPDPSVSTGRVDATLYFTAGTNVGIPGAYSSQVLTFESQYSTGSVVVGNIDWEQNLLLSNMTNVVQQGGTFTATGPWDLYDMAFGGGGQIGSVTSSFTWAYYSYNYSGGPSQTDIFLVSATPDVTVFLSTITDPTPSVIYDVPRNGGTTGATNISTVTKTFNLTTTPIVLSNLDYIRCWFLLDCGLSPHPVPDNFTASVSYGPANSSLRIAPATINIGGYPYATSSLGYYIDSITNLTPFKSDLVLNADVSQFYQYQYIPYYVSGGVTYSSSLYTTYGDVNVPLQPQPGDKIIMYDNAGSIQDIDVVDAEIIPSGSGDYLHIRVTPQVLPNWVIDPKLITKFLLLRRYNDEQNVILSFNKTPGATSYGFVIPNTINPQVTDNINTLQASVQSQILTQQSIAPGSSFP